MAHDTPSYFDQVAATWEDNPVRTALMKAVGEAVLRQARPTKETDALDYGCGTGLLSLFLRPHVRSVTGADSSAGMLDVLRKKIAAGSLDRTEAIRLDLEHDPVPKARYHLVVACMVLHHVADTEKLFAGFHQLLRPDGTLCLADLDTEPGIFHDAKAAPSVRHHGFDRYGLMAQLARAGFRDAAAVTAHTIHKPVEAGGERDFPVFLITARR